MRMVCGQRLPHPNNNGKRAIYVRICGIYDGIGHIVRKMAEKGEETDNHKILLVFVDEIQTELYSTVVGQTIKVHSKMAALDYELGKWMEDKLYDLLNEWFGGEIVFEVNSYYTTEVITEGFNSGLTSSGNTSYDLFVTEINETAYLSYFYHNTITVFGLNDYAQELYMGNGTASIKNADVCRERIWGLAQVMGMPFQDYLIKCKSGEVNIEDTIVETCLHELAHTAEMYFNFDYDLHTAIGHAIREFGNSYIYNTIKPYLLGEFDMNGVMCGVPMEYWQHKILVRAEYGVHHESGGRIIVVGEEEDPIDRLGVMVLVGIWQMEQILPLKLYQMKAIVL